MPELLRTIALLYDDDAYVESRHDPGRGCSWSRKSSRVRIAPMPDDRQGKGGLAGWFMCFVNDGLGRKRKTQSQERRWWKFWAKS